MRRMISETLMQKIKRLFKSVWSDDEGNVEVGKNVVVDGTLTLNAREDLILKTGQLLPGYDYDEESKVITIKDVNFIDGGMDAPGIVYFGWLRDYSGDPFSLVAVQPNTAVSRRDDLLNESGVFYVGDEGVWIGKWSDGRDINEIAFKGVIIDQNAGSVEFYPDVPVYIDSEGIVNKGEDGYKISEFALDAAVSHAKYTHGITLSNAAGAILFTANAIAKSNTPIDSQQDLDSVLGGRLIAGSGSYVQLDLHGGTSATDKLIRSDGTAVSIAAAGVTFWKDDVYTS